MAFHTTAYETTATNVAGSFFTDTMDRLALILRRRQVYSRICAELSACTDRDLYDLGIARSNIRWLARKAANDTI